MEGWIFLVALGTVVGIVGCVSVFMRNKPPDITNKPTAAAAIARDFTITFRGLLALGINFVRNVIKCS